MPSVSSRLMPISPVIRFPLVHNAFRDAVEKSCRVRPEKTDEHMLQTLQLSQRQACKVIRLPRSSFACQKIDRLDDQLIMDELSALVEKYIPP